MSCCAFQGLHNVDQGIRPAIGIAERCEQKVDMVGHDNDGEKIHSFAMFSETVIEDEVASRGGEGPVSHRAEGDEQITICFLQMRKPAPVSILGEDGAGHRVGCSLGMLESGALPVCDG